MEQERDEVYERIPWETLERNGGDRQWLVYAVAGAVVLGALAYSFTRNQPVAPVPVAAEQPVVSTVPNTTPVTTVDSPSSTVASPVVVAEADLFAVDPERLIDQAAGHAEWFAVEYVSYDGTEESARILEGLLPSGVPLPEGPDESQVFVDWARAVTITQTGPVSFDVDVVVRSLLSEDGSTFVRQAPLLLTVTVDLDDEGAVRVVLPPVVEAADVVEPAVMDLGPVPEEVAATVSVDGEVVGGRQTPDGGWQIVVMATGPDGVRRPITVRR